MELFTKKRISIIVETPFRDGVLQLLHESGAGGYTIYEGIKGKGEHGARGGHGEFKTMCNVEIVSITGPEVAEKILIGVDAMLKAGIVIILHISDVSVLRGEHFA